MNIYMETKSTNLCTCTCINYFYTLCTQTIYKKVVITFGTTVPVIYFYLDACNLSHLVSLHAFLLTTPVRGTFLCGALTYVMMSLASGGSMWVQVGCVWRVWWI